MWHKVKGCFSFLLLIAFFFALGIIPGVKVANIWFPLDPEPYWRLLESSLRFEHIVYANSRAVWAQTEDGKIYYREVFCDAQPNCDQWSEGKTIPIEVDSGGAGEIPMKEGSSCQFENRKPPKASPENIVECARGAFAGPEYGIVVYYSLIDDGSIWVWVETDSMIETIYSGLYYLCVISISSLFCIVALVIFVILRRIRNLSLQQCNGQIIIQK